MGKLSRPKPKKKTHKNQITHPKHIKMRPIMFLLTMCVYLYNSSTQERSYPYGTDIQNGQMMQNTVTPNSIEKISPEEIVEIQEMGVGNVNVIKVKPNSKHVVPYSYPPQF